MNNFFYKENIANVKNNEIKIVIEQNNYLICNDQFNEIEKENEKMQIV